MFISINKTIVTKFDNIPHIQDLGKFLFDTLFAGESSNEKTSCRMAH